MARVVGVVLLAAVASFAGWVVDRWQAQAVTEQRAMAQRGQELWSALSRREQDRARTTALAGEVGTTVDDCLLLAHVHRELGRAWWADRARWLPLAAVLDLPWPWERRHAVARRRNLDRARQLGG